MKEPEISKRSHLILIGGAEDKRKDKLILKAIIKITKAKNIAIIPSASTYSRDVLDSYSNTFRDLKVKHIERLDIRYRDEVDRKENFEMIDRADLVFISGGDQYRLAKIFNGSKLLQKIFERFYAGTLPIVGTSAGAAIISNPMIYDGDYEGFCKGTVVSSPGFGLLEGITVDTHFTQRSRIARLSQFLLTGKSFKGIGIDEDTAVIIYPNLRMEVIGSGIVTILNSDKITFNNYESLEDYQKFSTNNLRLGYLAPGTFFSLKKWAVLKPKKMFVQLFEGQLN
ncbi:MAG: cyanophycinase [Bacteroidetes bacterium]|jgi:cyanophycinase|nr:cyanophycinase [Bacteroidota bacterium]MBT6687106.1 cyanophycinase [Bacteroidota bacterium]MBT7144479.1 cyanophycinase [Bacteroidota bacterium]MBT7490808.1 cyanophycinase [Bacteroidota bacterium]